MYELLLKLMKGDGSQWLTETERVLFAWLIALAYKSEDITNEQRIALLDAMTDHYASRTRI